MPNDIPTSWYVVKLRSAATPHATFVHLRTGPDLAGAADVGPIHIAAALSSRRQAPRN